MGFRDLPPEMREAIDAIVRACRSAFGPHLRCVILKGSALKGDFVRNYSDLDLHAFVDPETLMSDRTPTLDYAMRFQAAIGGLEPRDVGASQFQVYFLRSDRPPAGWAPAVPGSYEVVYGEIPPALVNWKGFDFQGQAREGLRRIPEDRRMLVDRTLDKPNSRLPTYVRLAGTYLKNHAYSAAILASGDPAWALGLPGNQLAKYLEGLDRSLAPVGQFFVLVNAWGRVESDAGYARLAFRKAIEALEAVERWARPLLG